MNNRMQGPGGHSGGAPNGHGMPGAKHPKRALRRLFGYLRPHTGGLLVVALLVVISSLLSVSGPALQSQVIDGFLTPTSASFGDANGLLRLVLAMAAVYGGAVIANAIQGRLMASIAQKAMSKIRQDLFAHIQELSIGFFDKQPIGDLMSRLTNDMDAINLLFAQNLTQVISSVVSVISLLITMFLLNIPLSLTVILTVPLIMVCVALIARKAQPHFRGAQSSIGTLNSVMEEALTGEAVVIAFGQQGAAVETFRKANLTATESGIKSQFLSMLIPSIVMAMNTVSLAIVVGVGGYLALGGIGGVTIGLITAFASYARQFSRPVMQVANLSSTIQAASASAERIFEVIDQIPAVRDKSQASALDAIEGHVVFSDVDFSYTPEKPILKGIDLEAQPGETVALVGPTGAGKTTIINILTRFYDIDAGRITIDGTDIRDVSQDNLRGRLGIVLQDNFLFADTVMTNIRYGNLDATDEEVIAAAKLANADQFIRRLPHGYETELSERGGNLSLGQRQLIAIARAILVDPDILILDEATSNVDTRTEQHLQEALLRLMEGRTSFVIAHRLSTIRDADQVLVIRDGEVIERGTHESLLAQDGFYESLYMSQFKGQPADMMVQAA